MNPELFTTQLAQQAQIIRSLVQGVSLEQARWKPEAQSWSILEVTNHLYDEEREDFRAHLENILLQPSQPWARIDPQGWVTQREYNQRDLAQSLQNFLDERQKSLAWLQGLITPDWQTLFNTPFGPITAGDVFAAWVAHDLLHIRQLVELHWAYTVQSAQPFQVYYAGDW